MDPTRAPGVSCKRKDILDLTVDDYERWAEPVTQALIGVTEFLAGERIFQARDIPYRTQLVPMAAIRVVLGNQALLHGVADKVRRWYWCGVLGELYGGTTESRFARDLNDVVDWVQGGPEPLTVTEAAFNPSRLLTLRTRNSAAYKGVYALLMRDGCRDWMYDKSIDLASFFDNLLDIHHIFPKAWCDSHWIDPGKRESIVNKTAISFSTNRAIGGKAPSVYLPAIERRAEANSERLDQILRTHPIAPAFLRTDNFSEFFAARSDALLSLISSVMDKPVNYVSAENEGSENFEEETDEADDMAFITSMEQSA